jgi:hypothetical protein
MKPILFYMCMFFILTIIYFNFYLHVLIKTYPALVLLLVVVVQSREGTTIPHPQSHKSEPDNTPQSEHTPPSPENEKESTHDLPSTTTTHTETQQPSITPPSLNIHIDSLDEDVYKKAKGMFF